MRLLFIVVVSFVVEVIRAEVSLCVNRARPIFAGDRADRASDACLFGLDAVARLTPGYQPLQAWSRNARTAIAPLVLIDPSARSARMPCEARIVVPAP